MSKRLNRKTGNGSPGHFLGLASGGTNDNGGLLAHITRPIKSMSSKGMASGKFDKSKWQKRIRGYFKSKTKFLLDNNID